MSRFVTSEQPLHSCTQSISIWVNVYITDLTACLDNNMKIPVVDILFTTIITILEKHYYHCSLVSRIIITLKHC